MHAEISLLRTLMFVAGYLSTVSSYRILAYEPSPGHSHWNVMSAVLESLVDAGHEVVCVTTHRPTEKLANHSGYTHIDMSKLAGQASMLARDLNYAQVLKMFRSNAYMVSLATNRAQTMCKMLVDMPEMRAILDGTGVGGESRFHAVVMESLHSVCQSTLPGRLDVPAIYVVPSPMVDWMPVATGQPEHLSYLGTLLADQPTPKTFGQRMSNAMIYIHTNLVRWYHDAGARRESIWPTTPSAAMVFINTHHSVEPSRPLGFNIVEIGGIHLRSTGTIPKDLKNIMDKSNEFGIIVFTFGSLISMDSLPKHVLNALKFVFSQLPQTVIWKYENDHMPEKPENVVLCKWLPQHAILQHPNVKLFISHGGMSGVYESVDAGVPVLGVPLFYDQPRNIQNLVNLGMALSLNIEKITKKTISSAINQLLNDQSFSDNAKRVSSLFKDRPMTPSDSVVYWTEYLIRHGEEANITPESANAPWISHLMIDLFVIIMVTLSTFWFGTRFIIYKALTKIQKT